ncbi:MAG: hypothetical protein ACOZAO_04440 [Patescibacteria group bacterium]
MNKKILNKLIIGIVITLLVLHTLNVDLVVIDTTSIWLLIILIFTLVLDRVKTINYKELGIEFFEAKEELNKRSEKLTADIENKDLKMDKEKRIQEEIDFAFKTGLRIGGYFEGKPIYDISNFTKYKAADRETVQWDES